jgi:hypothetical protein
VTTRSGIGGACWWMSHPIHSSTLKPAIINAANPSQSLRVVSTGTPYSMGLASMGHAIPACMLVH